MTEKQAPQPGMAVWVAIGTLVLVLLGVAVIALQTLETARGQYIEDAARPSLIPTLVSAVGLLVAAGWAIWLARNRGRNAPLTLIASTIAVVLLVVTPITAWQAFTGGRELTVVTSTCNAESLRTTGGDPRASCAETAVETIVLLEAVQGNESWVPDTTGNLTREFNDLPPESWDARLTVDGPDDTVAVAVIAERDGDPVRVGSLRPSMDTEPERLRWSGVVPVANDVSTLHVQFYLSPNPAVESARIRFEVHSCAGQNIRSFNADRCEPTGASSPFVYEQSPDGTRTWRQLHVVPDGDAFVVSNLEARIYTLEPDYLAIENATRSTDVLIIPAAMDQVERNSITSPGETDFDIEIDASTGELTYMVYVFPTGPTYAGKPGVGAPE